RGAGNCIHGRNIDGHDMASSADALDRDLCPAAGGRTEVDDSPARRQEMEAVVELQQLEGGPRAIAQAPRLGDVAIVQLTIQPARRGRPPAAGALHTDGGTAA